MVMLFRSAGEGAVPIPAYGAAEIFPRIQDARAGGNALTWFPGFRRT